MRPQLGAVAFALILAIVVALLDLAWPLLLKRLIDCISNDHIAWSVERIQLNRLCGFVVALLVVKQCVDTVRGYRMNVIGGRFVLRLRRRLFDRILRLPLGEISEMKSGGVVSRLGSDVDAVGNLIQTAVIAPAVALLRIVCTLAILFLLSWRLATAAFLGMPILVIGCALWLGRVRPIFRKLRDESSEIDARIAETMSGIRVVRAFGGERRESIRYAARNHRIFRHGLRATRIQLAMESTFGVLMPAVSVALVWYGGRQVHLGRATIGDIFAFQMYVGLLLPPVWQIVQSVGSMQRAIVSAERIQQTLNTQSDKSDAPTARPAPEHIESIWFQQVSFNYRPDVAAIQRFDLRVVGGSTVAIVGPSGAGKTTLTDLLARFHDPTAGRVLLNGIDLRDLQLRSYRSRLAIVQQETFLFAGTIRENIAYGSPDASDEAIRAAARRANADEFISRLTDGYDTPCGERGVKLSGGQKQRLSIARAILADPQILILDEATSSLDSESEQLIHESLVEVFKNRTTIVIAHRLSTILHADQIVVMNGGRIVEVGTHAELMRSGREYPAMIQRQQRGFLAA